MTAKAIRDAGDWLRPPMPKAGISWASTVKTGASHKSSGDPLVGKSLLQSGSWTVTSNPIGQLLEKSGGSKDRLPLVFCMRYSLFEQKRHIWGEILLCYIKPPFTSREQSLPFTAVEEHITTEERNTLHNGSGSTLGALQEPLHSSLSRWVPLSACPPLSRGGPLSKC